MNKKQLNPKNVKPVIRKTSISLPELHEEQLTGGISDNKNAIAPTMCPCMCPCSFDGDDD